MTFFSAAYSDAGTVKKINQDSLLLKIAKSPLGEIAMGMICDGMGGLKSGEVASAHVVKTFDQWFCERLPQLLEQENLAYAIQNDWCAIVEECNKQIMDYGKEKGFDIGTTLTAICIWDGQYITVNVGDSRIYMLQKEITQLTMDQTFIEREIREGRMSREEAGKDPRRNVLLQCIGAMGPVAPDFVMGKVTGDAIILLCSDGFRHKIDQSEIYMCFNPEIIKNAGIAEENIKNMIEIVKKRGERDNITAAVIRQSIA